MFHVDPKHGFFTFLRKFYDKKNEEILICQDYLKYISLDKLGPENSNFAAILINGHNDSRICDQLQEKIISGLQTNSFSKFDNPEDMGQYIQSILSQFEENFLISMKKLSKERETMIRWVSFSKNQDSKQLAELADMEEQLNSGATVAIVAVMHGDLFISNIGDNQIILVSKDDDCNDDYNQKFILLTDEQNFHNEKEIFRIKEDCNLDPDALRWLSFFSTERCHSRCIGDYDIKCNYNKFQNLRDAKSSPLISTPQPSKCIPLEENFTHVLLISSGLYYLVRELIYDRDKVSGEITRKFFEIKCEHPELSLESLCKSVLESFVTEHKDCHYQCQNLTEDDFNVSEYSHHDDLSIFAIELNVSRNLSHDVGNGYSLVSSTNTDVSTAPDSLEARDSSNNMKDQFSSLKTSTNASLTLTSAYVDFGEWAKALHKISAEDLAFVDSIVDAQETCEETITEESESQTVSRSTTFEEKISDVSSPDCRLLLFNSIDG